jgi:hypothetical protein
LEQEAQELLPLIQLQQMVQVQYLVQQPLLAAVVLALGEILELQERLADQEEGPHLLVLLEEELEILRLPHHPKVITEAAQDQLLVLAVVVVVLELLERLIVEVVRQSKMVSLEEQELLHQLQELL